MIGNNNEIEKRLWGAADQLRANSKLKSSEYSVPVLGLIFLRFADHKFTIAKNEIEKHRDTKSRRGINKTDYQARGVLFLPENARFSFLLNLPEGENIGKVVNDAMKSIEAENEDLKDVLPKTYNRLENDVLIALLKNFSNIPMDIQGDVFGKIYEYFLGEFAMAEGQRGGEFFTPTALVRLIVEIIEPYHGRIYDPACGSGGMFVQSAKFVERHKRNPSSEISVYGEEKTAETIRLCKMNLAVHGLSGDIRQGNTYYEDIHINTLFETLKEDFQIQDERLLLILKNQLEMWVEKPTKCGIPQGVSASGVLANAYLHPLDTFLDNLKGSNDFEYFRYNDDSVIMAKSADKANHIVENAGLFLRKHNLNLNSKTKFGRLKNTESIEELKFYNDYGELNET
ncbi:MAG: N-6 DNA methylase, partial [Nitrospinota bacterium]